MGLVGDFSHDSELYNYTFGIYYFSKRMHNFCQVFSLANQVFSVKGFN